MFGTFKKNAISEEIATRVLTLIQQGQLSPGSKLPPERELAEMMQVSRPSLREALRALSIMNIIEIRQGDGTYVSSLEPDLLVEHLDFVFSINSPAIFELFEARRTVEVSLAALAAQRITDGEIDQLETCLIHSTETVADPPAFMLADIELHELIVEAARNPFLKRFMTSIYHLSRASRMRTMEIPGIREQAMQDHKIIVQALKARDPEQARQAMLNHLNNMEAKLLSLTDQPQQAEQLPSELLLD